MSLILIFHDSRRAVIAADDQVSDVNTQKRLGGYPKFALLRGGPIFACTGRASIAEKMIRGTRQLAAERGPLQFAELCGFLPFTLRKMWASRLAASIPEDQDNLAGILLGFDPAQKRMRAMAWFSRDNFAGFESTEDPLSRILCDGFWDESDRPELQALTDRMSLADQKGPAWIAAELRKSFDTIRQRHLGVIGEPCHFAALDRNGLTTLPAEFPLPSMEEYAGVNAEAEAVCATINISSFSMRIPGINDIPYNSGAISGLAYNTLYYVYTDDPGFKGGTVVYEAGTSKEAALDGAGRLFLGSIVTPAQGAPDTHGAGDGGSGAQYGTTGTYSPPTPSLGTIFDGNSSISNIANATDGNFGTSAALQSNASGTGFDTYASQPWIWPSAPQSLRTQSATLKIYRSVTNSLTNLPLSNVQYKVSFSTNNGASFTTAESINNGSSLGLSVLSIPLPSGMLLSQLILAIKTTAPSAGSGSIIATINEIWLEATE